MSLLEIQRAFGHALAAPGGPPPWIDSADADERLEVYRGTVRAVLVKALALNFPTVQRLVGAEFFEWAAALYALDHPPTAANLDGYGDGFADFLQTLPACSQLEYLPDVGRLDWAVARALHAEEAEPLAPAALSGVVERAHAAVFAAHPAIALLACRFPVDEIWSAVLGGEPGALEAVDLETGPCWLLVERDGLRTQVRRMTRPAWEFAQDIFTGQRLADALSRVGIDGGAAPAWLAQHLAAGRIVAWRITDHEEIP